MYNTAVLFGQLCKHADIQNYMNVYCIIIHNFTLGQCDDSNNVIIAIRKLISCYRYWLYYLSIIANNCIAQ